MSATATHDAPVEKARQLMTREPWTVCGMSRSAWYRLRSADKAPRPVSLPGSHPLYRVTDLEAWVESLKSAR